MALAQSDMVDVQEEKGREAKTKTNRVEKEIGNVNAASDISFEYGVKPEADLTNSGIEFLPFQVQVIIYTIFSLSGLSL